LPTAYIPAPPINARLFFSVYGAVGSPKFIVGPGFHFEEYQFVLIPANDVDFNPPAASPEVARHDFETLAA